MSAAQALGHHVGRKAACRALNLPCASFPGRDLIGVHVVAFGQFGERLIVANGVQSHLGLEGR